MAERNDLVPPSIWQVPPAQTDNVGMNDLQTKFQENEPAPRDFWLPEPYKSFLEESEKRYAQQQAEEAAAKEYQRELETRESDHEKVMRHLKLDFRIQVDGLKRENEELQITIDAFHMLFDKIRDKNTAEIQALTQAMQLLQGEVYAKAKELKVMYDAHDALVKKLEDERAELPKKLADSAKNALALQSNALNSSDKAVVSKGLASVPAHLKGKPERFAHCTQCMRHNWDCDRGILCKNCSMRGIKKGCRRVACEDYKKGICKNKQCRFAHEGEIYKRLDPSEDVWGDGRELSPVELDKMGVW
ncbi:uncharacterized protein J4E88_005324 [Alternaria novae-zelandiae]|uniref:uncharacterized protein n=1 Tax=Alternaria novae-zelandiae TaxID=430562 RepID=UPI0020C23577|nr:uncharacterized protein J4E88_005324 [Alternaria novae-zelandiae]KAI4682434.1 hypothetical protein J4E88_005324 [Alternaria novae-zelandiae]